MSALSSIKLSTLSAVITLSLVQTSCFKTMATKMSMAAKVEKFETVEEVEMTFDQRKGDIVGLKGRLLFGAQTTIRSQTADKLLFLDLKALPQEKQLELTRKCSDGCLGVKLVGELTMIDGALQGVNVLRIID
ncbi:MAG: hypothetical protein EOP04_17980 [Proteobacteria bacterium]|nr:MAG: hypothetical protein EOP04_17980 [Pseudomonadota bacterium]